MTEPVGPAARRAGSGLTSLLVALVANLVIAGWLFVRGPQDVVLGQIGGPIALAATAWSLQRIGPMVVLPRVDRSYWRQFGHGAVILLVSSCTALALANKNAGMSLYVA